jgi:hypothetical protein
MSIFRHHILHIAAVGSKKQVIGIDTTGIVTAMADGHSIGNIAVVELPRYTRGNARHSVNVNPPITEWTCGANPNPAAIGFLDFGKETHVKGCSLVLPKTGTRTPSACLFARCVPKWLSALFACSNHFHSNSYNNVVKNDSSIIPHYEGSVYALSQIIKPSTEQIEYHCPVCQAITVLAVGVTACKGCGRPLRLIQVDDDQFRDFGDN